MTNKKAGAGAKISPIPKALAEEVEKSKKDYTVRSDTRVRKRFALPPLSVSERRQISKKMPKVDMTRCDMSLDLVQDFRELPRYEGDRDLSSYSWEALGDDIPNGVVLVFDWITCTVAETGLQYRINGNNSSEFFENNPTYIIEGMEANFTHYAVATMEDLARLYTRIDRRDVARKNKDLFTATTTGKDEYYGFKKETVDFVARTFIEGDPRLSSSKPVKVADTVFGGEMKPSHMEYCNLVNRMYATDAKSASKVLRSARIGLAIRNIVDAHYEAGASRKPIADFWYDIMVPTHPHPKHVSREMGVLIKNLILSERKASPEETILLKEKELEYAIYRCWNSWVTDKPKDGIWTKNTRGIILATRQRDDPTADPGIEILK